MFLDEWPWSDPPERWALTIEQFVTRGLDAVILSTILQKAVTVGTSYRHAWLYFCKVCWAEVTKLEDRARELVGQPDVDAEAELEPGDDAYWEGYQAGFADGQAHTSPPVRTCVECDERPEWQDTGQCVRCWDTQLEVDSEVVAQ